MCTVLDDLECLALGRNISESGSLVAVSQNNLIGKLVKKPDNCCYWTMNLGRCRKGGPNKALPMKQDQFATTDGANNSSENSRNKNSNNNMITIMKILEFLQINSTVKLYLLMYHFIAFSFKVCILSVLMISSNIFINVLTKSLDWNKIFVQQITF